MSDQQQNPRGPGCSCNLTCIQKPEKSPASGKKLRIPPLHFHLNGGMMVMSYETKGPRRCHLARGHDQGDGDALATLKIA